ncbi:DUF4249 domain-containing protein [Aquirufa nivalisilvae]|uniref:DUF4249 domain-containing protein n=1 Tax=Aquirufa nivalisilvae TaxID=2516557 RepID=UPI001032DA39|nr:DUF4249 domain-containing protein [Aquirufa nivalisilvae]TBH75828.1 DUF4249 domain-containing protein [Aquirufa nivalisilvae]
MKRFLVLVSLLGLFSCETEITDFKTENLSDAFVVYGEMSNMAGPYTVRLNYTSAYSPFDPTQFQGQPVPGAAIRIVDETGSIAALKEIQKGMYQTPATFQGQVGKKYRLEIRTADGLDIVSDWQQLSMPLGLKSFTSTYKDADKVENMYFKLQASVQDSRGTEDYYFVKRQDFIQFLTTCPNPPPPPAPVPICYNKCWQANQNTQPILADDSFLDGREIDIPLLTIPYDDFTEWVVQLEVYHVDKATHQYWKRQEAQRILDGGIFDKVPAQIIGNMTCLNKPDRQVLGYFMVAGKSKERMLVDRYHGIPAESYQKLVNFIEFNKLRYQNSPLWDCRQAAWIPYNVGLTLPVY